MNIWGRRARRFPLCFVMNFVVFADSGAAARGLPPTVIQMDFSRYYRWSWFNLSPRSPGRVCLGSWHRGRGVPQWGLCLGDAAILGTAQGAGQGWCGPFGRGGRGQGPPRHPRRRGGLCATHPGDTVTIETAAPAGWEGRRMWQPPNPPGAGGTVPKKPPVAALASLGAAHPTMPTRWSPWSGQGSIPQPPPQLQLGPPGICPALIWGSLALCLTPIVPGSALQGSQILPGSFATWGTDPKT